MAKLNKKNTDDLFSGLKYVDKLLNEAAGVGNPPKKLSFEEKMKMKLKEGYEEAADLTEDLEEGLEEGNMDELTGHGQPHGYNYDGKNEYLGEEGLDEFNLGAEDDEDEFGNDEFGTDEFSMELNPRGTAGKVAARDMESEFGMEHEPEHEDEFDFTTDEALMESLLEADPGMDVPTDETIPPVAGGDATGIAPIEATPTDDMGTGDLGAGAATPEAGDVDMTTDAGLGAQDGMDAGADMGADLGGAPAMGGSPSPSGMEDPAAEMGTTPMGGTEDIDQLIADLVTGTGAEANEEPAMFGENAHNDLGFTDLKDQDINSNKVSVKMESKKGVNPFAKKEDEKDKKEVKEVKEESTDKKEDKAEDKKEDKKKSVKEGEIKLTKLGDADITGNVKGALTTGKAVTHSGTGKRVDPKGEEYTDLGDDDITSNKVGKSAEKAAAPAQPKFTALQKENVEKTKALYTLAEKVVTLEDEVANLKFKTFRLEKVNSILTLLPELKLATREKLVEKFDTCKSYAEAKKLYSEVAEMVKDHKRGSINEAVLKNQKSTKYFNEDVDNSPADNTDSEAARRNFLMGVKGYDDQYGGF